MHHPQETDASGDIQPLAEELLHGTFVTHANDQKTAGLGAFPELLQHVRRQAVTDDLKALIEAATDLTERRIGARGSGVIIGE